MQILISLLTFASLSWAQNSSSHVVAITQIQNGQMEAQVLTNSFGQTLYVFDPDGTGTPSCKGDCAEKWPPLLVNVDEAKELKQPLAVTARGNGLLQVSYKGRPVYVFFLDRKNGDLKGDGLGGVWHAVILATRRAF
jgi:predicted lipoprotein with Yx(FWY)xxD motif